MRFVVNLEKLADGRVGVSLRGGKRRMAQQLLNGAEVRSVCEQMCGESMPQRMRVQIPIHIDQTHIFFDDARHGSRRQARARMIEKNRLMISLAGRFSQDLIAYRTIG